MDRSLVFLQLQLADSQEFATFDQIPVGIQRMPSHVKTEQLLFVPQFFAECPGRNLRCISVLLAGGSKLELPKQGNLTRSPIALRRSAGCKRLIDLSE